MKSPNPDQNIEKLEKSLQKVLDSHGYGFQYAVVEKIKEIYDMQRLWLFEVAEFPVATRGHETRIDFVIKPSDALFYLIAECKRVNPSFSDWCFIRAPYVGIISGKNS
jgi:hypothetical protein